MVFGIGRFLGLPTYDENYVGIKGGGFPVLFY